MSTLLQHIPATEGVRKVEPDQGEVFDIAGAHLTWKVKGEDNGDAFAVCEQTLAPGERFFDAVAAVEKATSFASLPVPEAMQRVARIGAQYQMYFAPRDISSPVVGRRA